ncbi:hypothetical protein DFJ73DRAFT_811607, partial [Zopfochytrium polystomum]
MASSTSGFLTSPPPRADSADGLGGSHFITSHGAAADAITPALSASALATGSGGASQGRPVDAGIPIRYRTLSLHIDEANRQAKSGKPAPTPAAGDGLHIADIKHHLNRVDDVCTRFSSHPTRGLDPAAVVRKAADGKNKISPPPTKYLQKTVGYVFGGFNFLMWLGELGVGRSLLFGEAGRLGVGRGVQRRLGEGHPILPL